MSKFNFNDESDAVLDSNTKDSLLEVYVYEVSELLEQLEQIIIAKETSHITESDINEMFRVLHTIKGSSAMMGFDQVTALSHSLEDLISYVRENRYVCTKIVPIENGKGAFHEKSRRVRRRFGLRME